MSTELGQRDREIPLREPDVGMIAPECLLLESERFCMARDSAASCSSLQIVDATKVVQQPGVQQIVPTESLQNGFCRRSPIAELR